MNTDLRGDFSCERNYSGAGGLQQQGQAETAQLNAEHTATMDQLNAQGAEETAAFNEEMRQQAASQAAEMNYINH